MNSETYGGGPGLYPLRGDVSAESGATTVEVIGLQNVLIAPQPNIDGAVPTYVSANGDIEWIVPVTSGQAILVNGVGESADYLIFVNVYPASNYDSDVFFGIRVNGILVGD